MTVCFWFENQALEAAKFYVSTFKNSKLGAVMKNGKDVISVEVKLDGKKYVLLNGNTRSKPTEAISIMVDCKDQKEIDRVWKKLTGNGGAESRCGWCSDKYGVSWQILHKDVLKWVKNPAAFQAMLTMRKLDLKTLERAANGKS